MRDKYGNLTPTAQGYNADRPSIFAGAYSVNVGGKWSVKNTWPEVVALCGSGTESWAFRSGVPVIRLGSGVVHAI